MRLERLSDKNSYLFEDAFSLYKSAFPLEERRDDDDELNEQFFSKDVLFSAGYVIYSVKF